MLLEHVVFYRRPIDYLLAFQEELKSSEIIVNAEEIFLEIFDRLLGGAYAIFLMEVEESWQLRHHEFIAIELIRIVFQWHLDILSLLPLSHAAR